MQMQHALPEVIVQEAPNLLQSYSASMYCTPYNGTANDRYRQLFHMHFANSAVSKIPVL